MIGCFKVGLIWQGLTHDLSKYAPVEFWNGAKYYTGSSSPNNEERKDKGVSWSWLHHKGRNRHHFEYWIDYSPKTKGEIEGAKMPIKYVVEMYCDRVAACKNYQKDKYTQKSAYEYYMKGPAKKWMHPDTAALIESLLVMLAEKGEKETNRYIRTVVLKNKIDY